jgi:hypothetical protein
MGAISVWCLLGGRTVDPLRKIRVRFATPDNRYASFGDDKDTAGMDELVKVKTKPGSGMK